MDTTALVQRKAYTTHKNTIFIFEAMKHSLIKMLHEDVWVGMKFTDKSDVGKNEIIHLYKLIQMYPAEK